MLRQETAPGGGPGAGTRRRRVGAFSLTSPAVIIPGLRPNGKPQLLPPAHLTPTEAEFWAAAEAVKDTDPIEYRERRRLLLLAQAARYGT